MAWSSLTWPSIGHMAQPASSEPLHFAANSTSLQVFKYRGSEHKVCNAPACSLIRCWKEPKQCFKELKQGFPTPYQRAPGNNTVACGWRSRVVPSPIWASRYFGCVTYLGVSLAPSPNWAGVLSTAIAALLEQDGKETGGIGAFLIPYSPSVPKPTREPMCQGAPRRSIVAEKDEL